VALDEIIDWISGDVFLVTFLVVVLFIGIWDGRGRIAGGKAILDGFIEAFLFPFLLLGFFLLGAI
jgi:hypothetical protein